MVDIITYHCPFSTSSRHRIVLSRFQVFFLPVDPTAVLGKYFELGRIAYSSVWNHKWDWILNANMLPSVFLLKEWFWYINFHIENFKTHRHPSHIPFTNQKLSQEWVREIFETQRLILCLNSCIACSPSSEEQISIAPSHPRSLPHLGKVIRFWTISA